MTGTAAALPSVAVAFGGGGARGLAHIHVIEVLDKLGIRPVMISGSSIGAIMGAGMAAGLTGHDMREHVISTFGNRAEVMARLWKLRPQSLSEVMAGGLRPTQFNIEKVLRTFLPQLPDRFDQLKIPLAVTATDFYGQRCQALSSGDLYSAIGASAAIPGVFRPVRRDGVIYVDGGISDPVPFGLIAGKADITIAIDVVGGPDGEPGTIPTSIDAMFGASQLMMQSIITTRLEHSRPDIFLRPPVSSYRVLDFLKVHQILEGTHCVADELETVLSAALAFKSSATLA
jgi:NTE family protein